jgi:hypothetical protein
LVHLRKNSPTQVVNIFSEPFVSLVLMVYFLCAPMVYLLIRPLECKDSRQRVNGFMLAQFVARVKTASNISVR